MHINKVYRPSLVLFIPIQLLLYALCIMFRNNRKRFEKNLIGLRCLNNLDKYLTFQNLIIA